MTAMAQPEAYVGHAADLVADDFTAKVESTRAFLANFMLAFETFVGKLS